MMWPWMTTNALKGEFKVDPGTGNIRFEYADGHLECTLSQAISFHKSFGLMVERARKMVTDQEKTP